MTNLEMIQRFQDTFGTTYTVAKEYLEKYEWDILEAFVAYERSQTANANDKVLEDQEVVTEPITMDADETEDLFEEVTHDIDEDQSDRKNNEYTAASSTHEKSHSSDYKSYTDEREDTKEQAYGRSFMDWIKRNYAKAQQHRLNISKDGERITSMKLTTLFWLIILAVFTFFSMPFLLIAFIVSLFFGVNYKIEGPGEVRNINYTFDKITNWVDNTFKEKEDSENRNDN